MKENEDIYEHIKAFQRTKPVRPDQLHDHHPEMLYFGCSDARLDPVKDLGIEQGRALIYRNIGGRVPAPGDVDSLNPAAVARGEIPEWVSVGATLDFFINHIQAPPGKDGKPRKKHIVVAAHEPCGGFNACAHMALHPDEKNPNDKYLPHYLKAMMAPLEHVVNLLIGESNVPDDQKLEQQRLAFEEESVRQSLAHLRSYECVQKAEAEGIVQLHGWVLGTSERRDILELQGEEFVSMRPGAVMSDATVKPGIIRTTSPLM